MARQGKTMSQAQSSSLNGREIPNHLRHAVPHALTDAGIGGRNEDLKEIQNSVGAEPVDKADALRYNAVVRDGMPMSIAPDVRRTIAEGRCRPGFLPRYVSPNNSISPEARGLTVVKDENGDPVRWGNMILTEFPESQRTARMKQSESISLQVEQEIEGNRHEAKERIAGKTLPYRPALSVDTADTSEEFA